MTGTPLPNPAQIGDYYLKAMFALQQETHELLRQIAESLRERAPADSTTSADTTAPPQPTSSSLGEGSPAQVPADSADAGPGPAATQLPAPAPPGKPGGEGQGKPATRSAPARKTTPRKAAAKKATSSTSRSKGST